MARKLHGVGELSFIFRSVTTALLNSGQKSRPSCATECASSITINLLKFLAERDIKVRYHSVPTWRDCGEAYRKIPQNSRITPTMLVEMVSLDEIFRV